MRAFATLPLAPRLLQFCTCTFLGSRGWEKIRPARNRTPCAANDENRGIINKGWSKEGGQPASANTMSDAKLREGVNIVQNRRGAVSRCDVSEETMGVLKYMEQKLFDRKVMDTISRIHDCVQPPLTHRHIANYWLFSPFSVIKITNKIRCVCRKQKDEMFQFVWHT
jgi:hypothetical protein